MLLRERHKYSALLTCSGIIKYQVIFSTNKVVGRYTISLLK